MKRRINFTGRKRIPKRNIIINLLRDQEERVLAFNISIELDKDTMPADAMVFIEVYNRYERERFGLGPVSNINSQLTISLKEIGSMDNLKFRILVVDETGKHGKILAHADRIAPEASADIRSILPVKFDDLGQQIWNIDFNGYEGSPILLINEKIPAIHNIASSNSLFIMDIYPAVIREILVHMIFVDTLDSNNMPSIDWHRDWLEFSKSLVLDNVPSETYSPEEREYCKQDWLNWINEVISEFCLRRRSEWLEYCKRYSEGGKE